jgi:hypothetical protein
MRKALEIIKNSVWAILHGEFLLRLRIDKFFPHILWTFLLFWGMILSGMMVQKTLVKVEKNKSVLSEMKIYHAQKTVQIARLGRLSTVEQLLEDNGSDVTLPEKPADVIRK